MVKNPLLFIILFANCALTKAHPLDNHLEQCLQKESTTRAMSQCYASANQAWDKEMNKNYQQVMAKLKGDDKSKLRAAQRAWLTYRDSWLAASTGINAGQGTMAALSYGAQSVSLVKNQALMLQSLDKGRCANPDDC